ncbi:MAG: DUF3492 domain-containing protein [Deltaproteobacteria bacterium]|nr:DUF3492 domain-containing protein [Deltaproteobacteria bacterium]
MKSDVCMIVEGSYPYVVGGVSTWVHDLITSLKEISFSVVYIGVTRKHDENPKYILPKNVIDYREIHLLDPVKYYGPSLKQKKKAWAELELFLNELSENNWARFETVLNLLRPDRSSSLTPHDIL